MVTRAPYRQIAISGIERLLHVLSTWSPRAFWHALRANIWPDDESIRTRLVRLIWIPFWVLSDVPAPSHHRATLDNRSLDVAGKRLVAMLKSVRARQLIFRFGTILCRAVVLTLLAGCVWVLFELAGGTPVNSDALSAIAVVLGLIGIAFGWMYRPGVRETARMIDHSFNLADRLATAVDHLTPKSGRIRPLHIERLQIIEATNTLAILHRHPALRVRAPVRELVAVVGTALVVLALSMMRGTGDGLPAVGSNSVPAFVSAQDRLAQRAPAPTTEISDPAAGETIAEVQARADLSASAEADLLQIADALDDNPLTKSIADAIRAGDYERAAAELKAIAPQISQLSPALREDLAADLKSAADTMSGEHPDLQDATDDAGDGLRADPETAIEELNDLSNQIESTGSTIELPTDLAADMKDARADEQSRPDDNETRPEPGDNSAESNSETQEIAGDGGDAASGQNEQSGESNNPNTSGSGSDGEDQGGESSTIDQTDGNQSESQSGDSAGQQSSIPGQSGQPQESEGSNGSQSNGVPGEQGEGSDSDDLNGGQSDEARPGTGAGSGSPEDISNDRYTSDGAENDDGGTRTDDTVDPNIEDGSDGDQVTSSSDSPAPNESITLSRAPDDSGYQSGGSSSSSSGSGTGAAAGTGSVEQGDVGVSGPDSNRVPRKYRPIVEDYFSDGP